MQRLLVSSVILVGSLYAGARRIGPIPALGPFLDPINGVWAVAATADLPARPAANIPGLSDSVRVLFDDRAVPHIFAATGEDAVRALGYVVAQDRLFQLELQTRATAGTLSELLGELALATDRRQRALGLAWSAEREFSRLGPASQFFRLAAAYAEGVNAWIDAMGPRDLPLEYRLLGATPIRWEPVYALYLQRRMGYTLGYSTLEFQHRRARALVGEEAADALFPIRSPIQEPIQPGRGAYPKFDRSPLPPPELREEVKVRQRHDGMTAERHDPPVAVMPWGGGASGVDAVHAVDKPWGREASGGDAVNAVGWMGGSSGNAIGSNNWAVSPSRSATGHAILAGDPHLELTLPSVWYEAHMVVPGQLDVYGVTIPASPWIVIGFNRDVAWSFTNTEADVLDYYEEVLDDPEKPARYQLDGEWRPLEVRIEDYRGPGRTLLGTDTMYHTHRGPVIWRDGRAFSMRWTVLEAGTGDALYGTNEARSVDEWLEGMEPYQVPAQNGIVADRAGNIAIRSTGWFPIRPGDGRGDMVWDGATTASDWNGRWPLDQLPLGYNPEQGYLASANQQPIDPAVQGRYLNADWYSPWRAMRINELLRRDSMVTPEAMRRYQTDPGSAVADLFVPFFLEAAAAAAAAAAADGDKAELAEAARLLTDWDRRYTRENTGAVLFELALDELEDRAWDELVPAPWDERNTAPRRVATPAEAVLYRLLHDPNSPWWDDRATPDVVENRDAALVASLVAGLEEAKERFGDPSGGGWRWDQIQYKNIYHFLRFPSLSALEVPLQGGPNTLNPGGSRIEGSSWRMVVELSPEVRGWGVYPGGQSGNPVSRWYTDRLDKWVEGELDPLPFPRTPDDLDPAQVTSVLTLTPPST